MSVQHCALTVQIGDLDPLNRALHRAVGRELGGFTELLTTRLLAGQVSSSIHRYSQVVYRFTTTDPQRLVATLAPYLEAVEISSPVADLVTPAVAPQSALRARLRVFAGREGKQGHGRWGHALGRVLTRRVVTR